MDRTHAKDVEIDGGVTNGAILVCTTDRSLRSDVASVLRAEYPVRTAGTESDAFASIDESVTVLIVDLTDEAFSPDRIRERAADADGRFQIAAVVDGDPSQAVRDGADALVPVPVDDAELRSTVRWLHRRSRYAKTLGAYYGLSDQYATLATTADADADRLRSLEEQLISLRAELDDIGDALSDEDALRVALGDESDRSA